MSPRTIRILDGTFKAASVVLEYLAYSVILFCFCVFWIIT